LLVWAGGGLALLRADGSRLTRLGARFGRSLSPDGRRIAYERRGVIHTSLLNGRRVRKLGRGYAPRWSPDGAAVAYVQPLREAANGIDLLGGHLSLMNAKTGRRSRLLVRNVRRYFGDSVWIDWAPDGQRLVYAAGTHDPRFFPVVEPTYHLHVVHRSGRGHRRLTSGDGDDTSPVFSPDGTRILFTRTKYSSDTARHFAYVMGVTDDRPRRLWHAFSESFEYADTTVFPTLRWQPLRRW